MTHLEHPQDRHPDFVPRVRELDGYIQQPYKTDALADVTQQHTPLTAYESIFSAEPEEHTRPQLVVGTEALRLIPMDKGTQKGKRAAEFFFKKIEALGLSDQHSILIPYVANGFTGQEISDHLYYYHSRYISSRTIDRNTVEIREATHAKNKFRIISHLMEINDEPPADVEEPKPGAPYSAEYELSQALTHGGAEQWEVDIINLAVRGWETKDIAHRVGVHHSTVKRRVRDNQGDLWLRRMGLLAHLLEFKYALPQLKDLDDMKGIVIS